MSTTLLEMKDISKHFFGVKALEAVNLSVRKGEIHAIVGENGAGKSTLMNILSGVYPHGSFAGTILFEGQECQFQNIKDSEQCGIGIIHQELALVPLMSIAENMFLGNEKGSSFRIDWQEADTAAQTYLSLVGLQESSRTLIKDLGVGKQQLVEIAKALAKNVRLLILDEPTASLNEIDSRKLLDLMLSLKERGTTCIIISHKLGEISYVADRITVIRDGQTMKTLDPAIDDVSEANIIHWMVGRELVDRFPKKSSVIKEKTLEVKNWTVLHPLYPDRKVCDRVSLHLRAGEVVGISGLMGAGRTELALSLFGQSYGTKIEGELILHGAPVSLKSIQDAIAHRIAYVTEDRKGDGLILSKSIRENTTLANLRDILRHRFILDHQKEQAVATEYQQKLSTKCASVDQNVGDLSGGNQQKVLLAKWMFTNPDILILDEPTRGIDVGAKYEIYQIMNQLVADGKSILVISSELPEILGICDRIYVMNEGRIVAEFLQEEASQEAIMASIVQSNKGVQTKT